MVNERYTTDLQPKLPSLPVPELAQTLTSLEIWATPLLNQQTAEDFYHLVRQFSQTDGPILQKRLISLARQTSGSWLAPIWEESYLTSRQPLQNSTNFAFTVDPAVIPPAASQSYLAAQIIDRLTGAYLSYATGNQPLETYRNGNLMDMSYYQNFFKAMRLARLGKDSFYQGDSEITNQQVAIISGRQLYFVTVTDADGRQLPAEKIAADLTEILNQPASDSPFVGEFTGLPRDQAAQQLTALLEDDHNRTIWHAVSDALFTVSFETAPADHNYLRETLLGVTNRFVDKPLQIVIYSDSHVGFAIEHSRVDGVPALNLIQHALTGLGDHSRWSMKTTPPKPVSFHLTPELTSQLKLAADQNQRVAGQITITTAAFDHFGKNQIKQFGVSPDAFFHIALALAMYRLTGTWQSIYEPVSMRNFYQGRTEDARSVSLEKKRFIAAFEHQEDPRDLKQLFETAAKAHTTRIRLAQQGFGVERHLLGLETVFNQNQNGLKIAKTFFASPQLAKLRTDFLSTTSIPFPVIQGLTFAPTSTNGYGVYYGILKDDIRLAVSSWQGAEFSPNQWLVAIGKALDDLHEMVLSWPKNRNRL